jgi:ribosomal silencing factor RsfS
MVVAKIEALWHTVVSHKLLYLKVHLKQILALRKSSWTILSYNKIIVHDNKNPG